MALDPVRFTGRVIIVGIDGMHPPTLERLMAAGRLPHCAALAQEGGYRRLATTNPAQSPVAWMGFATGKNPGKHGLVDFIRRDPQTMALSLSTAHFVQGKYLPVVQEPRLWDYLTQCEVESVILHCPVTFPPARIHGRMLAGMGVPDALGTEGTFTCYTSLPSDPTVEGGKVVPVDYAARYDALPIFGPRRDAGGRVDHVVVPMRVELDPARRAVEITIRDGQRVTLAEGQWSAWQPVTFSLGLFKKMKGLVRFHLVQAQPDLLLYASPVNFDPREPFFPLSHPDGYAKEVAERIGLYYTQGMPNETWSLNEGRLTEAAFLARVAEITAQKQQLFLSEVSRQRQGVVFAYFDALDVGQHMFWRCTDPSHPAYRPDGPYRDTIEALYLRMDELLGAVRAQCGPDDTLLVLSDHGFGAFRRAAHVNAWLRDRGYLALADGAATGGELLKDVDWAHTRAYALGFGSIYLNRRGREQHGIVPADAAPGLSAQLRAALADWRDADGTPVVHRAYARDDIYAGPHTAEAPDLVIGFNDGYRASWQTALGAVPAPCLEDNTKRWSGDHLIDPALVPGVLLANRPLPAHPTLYDLTPTVLQLVGASDAQICALDFDGSPLGRAAVRG